MSQILISIPEEVADLLGNSPEQVKRRAHELIALDLYRRRLISAGRAGEVLGLDEQAFIQWAESLGAPSLDNPPED
jgi:hypothetical protein